MEEYFAPKFTYFLMSAGVAIATTAAIHGLAYIYNNYISGCCSPEKRFFKRLQGYYEVAVVANAMEKFYQSKLTRDEVLAEITLNFNNPLKSNPHHFCYYRRNYPKDEVHKIKMEAIKNWLLTIYHKDVEYTKSAINSLPSFNTTLDEVKLYFTIKDHEKIKFCMEETQMITETTRFFNNSLELKDRAITRSSTTELGNYFLN